MQLLLGSDKILSAADTLALADFMEKQLGFVGITIRPVNGDWVMTAEGREFERLPNFIVSDTDKRLII